MKKKVQFAGIAACAISTVLFVALAAGMVPCQPLYGAAGIPGGLFAHTRGAGVCFGDTAKDLANPCIPFTTPINQVVCECNAYGETYLCNGPAGTSYTECWSTYDVECTYDASRIEPNHSEQLSNSCSLRREYQYYCAGTGNCEGLDGNPNWKDCRIRTGSGTPCTGSWTSVVSCSG